MAAGLDGVVAACVDSLERAERTPSIVAADRLTRARVKARAVLEQAEELRRVIE